MPKDDKKCRYFAVTSIDSLLVYENKYYLKVYIENCGYKIIDKQVTDYVDDNLFVTD